MHECRYVGMMDGFMYAGMTYVCKYVEKFGLKSMYVCMYVCMYAHIVVIVLDPSGTAGSWPVN